MQAEKNGKQIVYLLDEHKLSIGARVLISIDWNRRYKLMRLHFAAEVVLELITQHFNNPEKIGAHISEDKARVDFYWQGNISQAFHLIENEIHQLVNSNLPIISAFSDLENEYRYWEIDGFAKVPCGGTHLKRTGENGEFSQKNTWEGKERIEIYLNDR